MPILKDFSVSQVLLIIAIACIIGIGIFLIPKPCTPDEECEQFNEIELLDAQ